MCIPPHIIQNSAILCIWSVLCFWFTLQVGCTKVENSELPAQYLMVRVVITVVILKCDCRCVYTGCSRHHWSHRASKGRNASRIAEQGRPAWLHDVYVLSEWWVQDVESNRFARHEIKNGMLNCINLMRGVTEMLEQGVQVSCHHRHRIGTDAVVWSVCFVFVWRLCERCDLSLQHCSRGTHSSSCASLTNFLI